MTVGALVGVCFPKVQRFLTILIYFLLGRRAMLALQVRPTTLAIFSSQISVVKAKALKYGHVHKFSFSFLPLRYRLCIHQTM